jgi:hypothetical protein
MQRKLIQGRPFDQVKDRAMAEETGPAWQGPGAAGRARASAGEKLHGGGGHGQERRRVMARMVAGFEAGGTRIDRVEDVSNPGFFKMRGEQRTRYR